MGMESRKYGGLESFLVGLVKESPQNEYLIIFNELPESDDFLNDIHFHNVRIMPINFERMRLWSVIRKWICVLKEEQPDIIHFHFGERYTIFALLARIFSHSALFKTNHCCFFRNGKEISRAIEVGPRTLLQTLGGYSYRLFDKIICVSDFVQKQMLDIFHVKNLQRVYFGVKNPIDIDECHLLFIRKSLGINDDVKVICSILFSNTIKAPDVLLQALPYLNFNYKLILIGLDEDNEYTQQMHELAERLGVSDRIIWLGIVNDANKYLAVADIYVQPSRTEALGLAALEAMSYKLPVVASNVGGLPELTNLLFPSEDSDSLASVLNDLANDEERYRNASALSYQLWQDTFRVNEAIREYKMLYENYSRMV